MKDLVYSKLYMGRVHLCLRYRVDDDIYVQYMRCLGSTVYQTPTPKTLSLSSLACISKKSVYSSKRAARPAWPMPKIVRRGTVKRMNGGRCPLEK